MPRVDWRTKYRVDDDGCWIFKGEIDKDGYGRFTRPKNGTRVAHRAMFIEYNPDVSVDGLVIDHLCRNRSCVNPGHLEPVTSKENTRRGLMVSLKTRCNSGEHEWTRENIYVRKDGKQQCLACKRKQGREAAAKLRAKRALVASR